jgi:hypothetical protein
MRDFFGAAQSGLPIAIAGCPLYAFARRCIGSGSSVIAVEAADTKSA